MKKVLIIGAGPAGLTAAYELLTRGKEYEVTILEQSDSIGGISRTVVHNGNRMDIGGHRFFLRIPKLTPGGKRECLCRASLPWTTGF